PKNRYQLRVCSEIREPRCCAVLQTHCSTNRTTSADPCSAGPRLCVWETLPRRRDFCRPTLSVSRPRVFRQGRRVALELVRPELAVVAAELVLASARCYR